MRARTSLLRWALLALVAAAGGALAREKSPPMPAVDSPAPEWRQGPVWYLLTDEEDRAFKILKTAEERRAFIEAFWARRDPTPWSMHNELRETFWKRVQEATSLFTQNVKPGWKTERGKLYILFGPPKDFHTYEQFPVKRRDFQWRYEADDFPPAVAEVVQSTLNPPLSNIGVLGETVLRPPQSPQFQDLLTRLLEDRLRAGDLAKMMRLPVTDDHVEEIITTSEFYNSIPVHGVYDFYRSGPDTTFSTLTLSVPARMLPLEPAGHAAEGSIVLYAKLVQERNPAVTYSFTNRLEATETDDINKIIDDGQMIFQAKGDLIPGRYRFYFGLESSPAGQVSFFRDTLNVPVLQAKTLELSSITLPSRLERAPLGYDDRRIPFILGPHKVVPRPTRSYKNGQTLNLYYEVYGARPDPKTGQPLLEIDYRFQVSDQGRFVRIGNPFTLRQLREPVQRWSFPLSHWPEAEYRVDIKVKDRIGGEVATGEAFFFIERD